MEFKLEKEHAAPRALHQRYAGGPAEAAFANQQRHINPSVGTNGVYGSTLSLSNVPNDVMPVASGSLPPTGYYLGNGLAYGCLGNHNLNFGNGNPTAMYGQGGTPASIGGLNAFNNSYGISPLGLPHIISYNPAGYHGSAYVYHPSGSSHGNSGHPTPSNGH